MVVRRLLPLLLAVVALGVGAASAASAAPAQDVTSTTAATFGGSDSSVAPTSETTTTVADEGTSQTPVTVAPEREERLVNESRRILAVIGGLVAVALALALLTVRYWIATRPVRPAGVGASVAPDDEPVFVDDDAPSIAAAPAGAPEADGAADSEAVDRGPAPMADHEAVGADWEPRGTGEHEVVPASGQPGLVRPPAAARRRALGGDGT